MKKYILLFLSVLIFSSCNEEQERVMVTLKFTHNWDGVSITNQDFNSFKFTNENGELISIERLRYVISNITLIGYRGHTLVDVGENSGNNITIQDLPIGIYSLKFRFGFSNFDNIDGAYPNLNSVNFNVPEMLGGGYHYMQFDGKYKDANNSNANFNYHAIRAVDRTNPDNIILDDTSFVVDLGTIEITNTAEREIKMIIAEWFKNPNTWDLNQLNTLLMPNFSAQQMISQNGKSVFSLGSITQ